MRTGAFGGLIDEVMSIPGIRGALVVAIEDGLVVDGRVHVGVHGEAVAALSAALYRRARRAAELTGALAAEFVEVEADRGRVLIAGNDDLALMAVVERRANPGRTRLAVRRAADELRYSEDRDQE